MIKPIETKYKGYRFRSRLEARWAVFFDTVGIQWVYEPEGYVLDGGVCYLPDFYFPEWGTYVEIKPDIPDDLDAIWKLHNLAVSTNTGGHNAKESYLICGTPGMPKFEHRIADPMFTVGDGYAILSCSGIVSDGLPFIAVECFAMTDGGTNLDVWPMYTKMTDEGFVMLPYTVRPQNVTGNNRNLWCPTIFHGSVTRYYLGKGVTYDSIRLRIAYNAARAAHFEHGDEPGKST